MVAWVPAAAAAETAGGPWRTSSVKTATPGQDFLNGTNGVQDTFVFTLGQVSRSNNPVTIPFGWYWSKYSICRYACEF